MQKSICLFFTLLLILTGCSDDLGNLNDNGNDVPVPVARSFTVNIDDQSWTADLINAFIEEDGGEQTMTVVASTASETNGEEPKPSESFVITITVPGTVGFQIGDYSGSAVTLTYIIDFPGQAENEIWQAENAEILLLGVETEFVNGTFDADMVLVGDDEGTNSLSLRDGEFSARF